jgi:hypothetical protein
MEFIDSQKLKDKNNAQTQSILSASFEYMLAGICREHYSILGCTSMKSFNEKNSLVWSVLTSYPFFVSLANGNSKSLFDLFGDFYATHFGPISLSVYMLMEEMEKNPQTINRKFKYFENPRAPHVNVAKAKDTNLDFDEIQDQILSEILYSKDGNSTPVKYSDIEIRSDSNSEHPDGRNVPLFKAIKKSLEIIIEQSGNTFFDGDFRTIAHQANFYDAIVEDEESVNAKQINYDDLKEGKRYRAFFEESLF